MKHKFFAVLLFISLTGGHTATSQTHRVPAHAADITILQQWHAGSRVSEQAVAAYGLEHCFTATGITDNVFRRINGKSYRKGCRVPRSQLRYLHILHHTLDGHTQLGELICHQSVAADLLSIFRQLYQARYPIERMVLIDEYGAEDEPSMAANNTTCFNYRTVAGSSKLSAHSLGKAVDINPLYNPCVKTRHGHTTIQPARGKAYTDRNRKFNYKIDRQALCYRLFRQHGFTWGGDWRSLKDYQHFEKTR